MTNSEKAPPPEYEETSANTVPINESTGQPVDAVAQAAAAIQGNAAERPNDAFAEPVQQETGQNPLGLPTLSVPRQACI